MTYNYTVKADPKKTAMGVGRDLSISHKQSIQITKAIRGKKVDWAKKYLEDVINQKQAVKMTRFNKDVGHKKGIGPGRYPIKACTAILALVKSVETNAQYKGLGGDLVVETIVAHKGSGQWHYGRQRRRQMKRSTVEVVLKEVASKKADKPKATKKPATKIKPVVEKKAEPAKEAKSAEPKPVEKAAAKVEEKKPVTVEKKPEVKKEEANPTPATSKQEVKKEESPSPKVEEKKPVAPAQPTATEPAPKPEEPVKPESKEPVKESNTEKPKAE